MIRDETELQAARARVDKFHSWLLQMRKTARPAEFEALSSGYRLEIERVQADILDYLLKPDEAQRAA